MENEVNIYIRYNEIIKSFKSLQTSYDNLSKRYRHQQNNMRNIIEKEAISRTKKIEKQHKEEIKEKEDIIIEKDKEIEALKKEIAKLHSVMNNNSSNSGIPTSKTQIGEKKYIPNTREKTNNKIGGQEGHKKHKLKAFKEEEATEIVNVLPENCPKCGSEKIIITDESTNKCEVDYEVKVIKRMYKFKNCICKECNNKFHVNIPDNLKEENQYGTTVQSLAVCLTNEIYTPFNKVVKLIKGMTKEEINLSEGYVAKLQKRASKNLVDFISDLKEYFPKRECYAWDDGVISINTKNGILRTYCTDEVAYFTAHEKKDEEGLDKDGILKNTTSYTTVMHDHILHNYNEKYSFKNVECMIHLIRRLNKMKENTKHKWCDELKQLLSLANKERNKLIENNETCFKEEKLKEIYIKYEQIIEEGILENQKDKNNYFINEEASFLKDLIKYEDNYLLWCKNFNLPSTNNVSERNIRPVKSKMKISGQFKNIENAKYYANIRSYIETCKKNGINIIEACVCLMEGNPYTLEEILNYQKTTD